MSETFCLNTAPIDKSDSERRSVDSVVSLLKRIEVNSGASSSNNHGHTSDRDGCVRRPTMPSHAPVQVLSELELPLRTARTASQRAYSLYSTDSESTITGTKAAIDKVSRLISLLMGKEVELPYDFDETTIANEVLGHLSAKDVRPVKTGKENTKPSSETAKSRSHERKNSKGFPKVVKRKTIAVKNVKAKPIVAAIMKQHQDRMSDVQQKGSTEKAQSPQKKFVRPCCQQPASCGHAPIQTKEPTPAFASWRVETPSPNMQVLRKLIDKGDETSRHPVPISHEIPVRDSDPVTPLVEDNYPQPLPQVESKIDKPSILQSEIENAVQKEDSGDPNHLKTFHSQRRALRFLLNELKDLLKAKHLTDPNTARVLEAMDKIVTMMQKSHYSAPRSRGEAEDEVSSCSFASIDIDLAMQPLRSENAILRSKLRTALDEKERILSQFESQMKEEDKSKKELERILEEINGNKFGSGASLQIRIIAAKERLLEKEKEVSCLSTELNSAKSSITSLTSERQDLLRLLGSKEGDVDKARLEALEEVARLRGDLARYESDISRKVSEQKDREDQQRILEVQLGEKEDEIQKLKGLVASLQNSMASLVNELRDAGPGDSILAPTTPPILTPPLPASLLAPATPTHLVGPGGDGPFQFLFHSNVTPAVQSNSSKTTSLDSGKKNLPLPKAVSDSLREFLQDSKDSAPSFKDSFSRPKSSSPIPSANQDLNSEVKAPEAADSSRFSVSAYLKRYGLQIDGDRYQSSSSGRRSGTFAQSTPASTPQKKQTRVKDIVVPAEGHIENDGTGLFVPLRDEDERDSTLTGISEISSISAITLTDGKDAQDPSSLTHSAISSLASNDEMEFKAGLDELDASIQRLKMSLKKSGKNL